MPRCTELTVKKDNEAPSFSPDKIYLIGIITLGERFPLSDADI